MPPSAWSVSSSLVPEGRSEVGVAPEMGGGGQGSVSVSSVPAKGEQNISVRAPGVHSATPHNLREMPVPLPGNGSPSLPPAPRFQQRLPCATHGRQGGEGETTTGELGAQPEKTHSSPEEQARMPTSLNPPCSGRSISGTILGPRTGCSHPGPGTALTPPGRHPDPARSGTGEATGCTSHPAQRHCQAPR